jgi:hypothetical protein
MYLHNLDLGRTVLDRKEVGRTAHLPITDLAGMEVDRTEVDRTEVDRTDVGRTDIGRTEVARTKLGRTQGRT